MAAYVRDQGIINERRMKEMEEQARANEAAALAATATVTTLESNNAPTLDSNVSTSAVSPGEISTKNQDQTLAT